MANSGATRSADQDPYRAFQFKVEISREVVGGFSEVSGLGFEREIETFREGGVNGFERMLPGPGKFSARLVLKRGLGKVDGLWSWCEKVANGQIRRTNVTVLLIDAQGNERRRWVFKDACPVKWSGPDLRANTSEIAFESVEFVHRGFGSVT